MTFLHKLSHRLALMKARTVTAVTGVPTPATTQLISPKTVTLQQSEAPNLKVVRASGGLLHLMMEHTP